MEKKQFLGASTSAIQGGSTAAFNDDPYAIELDKLDVFNIVDNDGFMGLVLEAKKSLMEEAKVMRKLMQLDKFTLDSEKTLSDKSKDKTSKTKIVKKARRRIVDDEDDEMAEIEVNNTEGAPKKDVNDGNKAEDDESEEEEVVEEDIEEDNDYMETYFDNGEDYID